MLFRSALTLALMALLALGPFLHAHYGNSRLTGFHVDGISQAVSHADTPFQRMDSPRHVQQ